MSFYSVCSQLSNDQESFVVVTLINIRGSAPGEIGKKLVVTNSGYHWGTVGGGKVEAYAIQKAQDFLKIESTLGCQILTLNLQKDIGMSCGGEVSLLFEIHLFNRLYIRIFGAGHIAQELVPLLSKVSGVQIDVIDSRTEWLNKIPQRNNVFKILLDHPMDRVKDCSESDYFICVTKGHDTDLPILRQIFEIHKAPRFVGVIGSEVKAQKIKMDLKNLGVVKEQIEQIHCPLGLFKSSNDPYEISISILAQILNLKNEAKNHV